MGNVNDIAPSFNFGPGSTEEQHWYELQRLLCGDLEDSSDDDRTCPIPQDFLHALQRKYFRGLRVLIGTGNEIDPTLRTHQVLRGVINATMLSFVCIQEHCVCDVFSIAYEHIVIPHRSNQQFPPYLQQYTKRGGRAHVSLARGIFPVIL